MLINSVSNNKNFLELTEDLFMEPDVTRNVIFTLIMIVFA